MCVKNKNLACSYEMCGYYLNEDNICAYEEIINLKEVNNNDKKSSRIKM